MGPRKPNVSSMRRPTRGRVPPNSAATRSCGETNMAKPKAPVAMPHDDYQAEDDMRTMRRAMEIHMDRKRRKAAMAKADKEINQLTFLRRGYKKLIDSD